MADIIGLIAIQEMQNEASDVEFQEAEVFLYSFERNLQTREFKKQTSGVTKCSIQINSSNSVEEFKNQIWLKIQDKLKREIVFDDNEPRWHENVTPKEEDMERFVLFYDAKSKRSLTLEKINNITRNHWRSKEIWLYAHVYSMSVSNLSLWKKVLKSLIEPLNRDRAGASTISEMNSVIVRLKEIHKLHYQASHINWIMWANRIQASEPHLREKLIHQETCFISTTRSLITSMEQALPIIETDFGRQVFSQIQDQEDIDHM